jgi:hypothetical protein
MTRRNKGKSPREAVRPTSAHARRQALLGTARSIILKCTDPARLLEFHYWSRQPGLADFVRASLALAPGTRTALHNFLTTTSEPREISVAVENTRRLTLVRAEAASCATTGSKRRHNP